MSFKRDHILQRVGSLYGFPALVARLLLTPCFSGVWERREGKNRFNGLRDTAETVETVPIRMAPRRTQLKQGVNEREVKWRTGMSALRLGCGLATLGLGLCLALPLAAAGAGALTPYEARALLLFKIAQFTEWPAEAFPSASAPFVVGILGDDPFKGGMEVINGKTIKGRQLVVKHFANVQEAVGCQLLFISSSEGSRLEKIIKALENLSVMTVSEMDKFIEHDGMVKLDQQKTKGGLATLRFDINQAVAEKAKLRINSQLLAFSSKK